MAEGMLKHLYPEKFEVCSAGTNPAGINPDAVKVMAEIGIDISGQKSEGIKKYMNTAFDYVVTVCDSAKETCPAFPDPAKVIHKGFYDPAKTSGSKEEVLDSFRRIRDEMKEWITDFFKDK